LWTIAAPWLFMADMVAYNGEILAFHHSCHLQSITQNYTNFSFVSTPSFYWMCLLTYIVLISLFFSLCWEWCRSIMLDRMHIATNHLLKHRMRILCEPQ
jgi:hypothetical protein